MLLFGGAIQLAGEVRAKANRRQTRSDWMGIERARGISVVTFIDKMDRETRHDGGTRLSNEDDLNADFVSDRPPLPIRSPDRKAVPGAERKAEPVSQRQTRPSRGGAQTACRPGEFDIRLHEGETEPRKQLLELAARNAGVEEMADNFGEIDHAHTSASERLRHDLRTRLLAQHCDQGGRVENDLRHSPLSARRCARKASTDAFGLFAV